MNGNPDFARWVVAGHVKCQAPMSIRTGEYDISESDEEVRVLGLDLDHRELPFIPATAFKGVIRSFLSQALGGSRESTIDRVFGRLPEMDEASGVQAPQGGRAEFSNLFAQADRVQLLERGMTQIDPQTGAVKDATLRHSRMVPPDTAFSFEIRLDGPKLEEVHLLLAGLRHAPLRFGSNSGSGLGAATLEVTSVKKIDASAIRTWCGAPENPHWRKLLLGDAAEVELEGLIDEADHLLDDATDVSILHLDLSLILEEPFLVSKAQASKNEPDLVPFWYENEDETVVLPGSSMRGALRAQAERILRTLAEGGLADDLVVPIFGNNRQKGALGVGDFRLVGERESVTQEFVAIDRVTGGARDGAQYTVRRFEEGQLKGRISLRLSPRRYAAGSGKPESAESPSAVALGHIGLLALVLRDLAEGDIRLGYGKTKGFGAVLVDNQESRSTTEGGGVDWCASIWKHLEGPPNEVLSQESVRSWIESAVQALRNELQRRTDEANRGAER